MKQRTVKLLGAAGMLCLQVSTIPALVQAIRTGEAAPISSLLLITIGMVFCIIQEWYAKLWAYVVGSFITIVGHICIIVVLLTRT